MLLGVDYELGARSILIRPPGAGSVHTYFFKSELYSKYLFILYV